MTKPAVTLAEGETRTEQLKRRYPVGRVGARLRPASRCNSVFMGPANVGKSRFAQTMEGAVILNPDNTPTTHPNPRASIVDIADFQDAINAVNAIIDDPGDTEMVWIDSLNAIMPMAYTFAAFDLIKRRARRQDEAAPPTELTLDSIDPSMERWTEGRIVWPLAHNWLFWLRARITAAGLGFGLIMHVDEVHERVQIGDEIVMQARECPAATDTVMGRIFRTADNCFYMTREDGKRKRKVGVRTVDEDYSRTFIVTRYDPLKAYLKARTPRPLPARINVTEGGWSDFENVFNSTVQGAPLAQSETVEE